ncbi:MAG TPA: VPLPA-CTERM sorting domain-containing protein, partial [Gammaproteobacteria bacterium]|nr:VPLPA-CTERM sorting domain-containing protein [Gammaproteobacteria bacterium]
ITSTAQPVTIDALASVNPGDSAASGASDIFGMLTFGGDVSFDAALNFELGLFDFDSVDILGGIDFGPNSMIAFSLNGYQPAIGELVDVLFAQHVGGFDNILFSFPDLAPGLGLGYEVLLTPEWDLQLSFTAAPVPLPASVWLFLCGLAGMAVVARRKSTTARPAPRTGQ